MDEVKTLTPREAGDILMNVAKSCCEALGYSVKVIPITFDPTLLDLDALEAGVDNLAKAATLVVVQSGLRDRFLARVEQSGGKVE
jgi:hypothetical protein